MVDLPIELWDSIALQTTRHDLLHLALVSSILLHVSRRALIRSISLDGDGIEIGYEKMLVFIKEHDLAGSIRNLTVRNFNIAAEASTIPFGAMTNLKRLSVYDCPPFCLPSAAQNVLIYHIENTFKDLQSIRMRNTSSCPLPTQFASISWLREITWNHEQNGSLSPALTTLLTMSCDTLQTLNICLKSQIRHADDYMQLFSFHFPRLVSLSLGPGHHTLFIGFSGGSDKQGIRNAFTSFLTANHKIRRLMLPIDSVRHPGGSTYLQFTIPSPTSTFLPNLVMLGAHPSFITELARAKAPFFQSLKMLSLQKVTYYSSDALAVVDDMFNAFAVLANDTGKLPLQHLRLTFAEFFPESQVSDRFSEWMTTSASVFPSLETIFSTVVPGRNIIDFPHFQHLRTISCVLGCTDVGRKEAGVLASKCPSLRRLSIRKPRKLFTFTTNEALNSTMINIYTPDYNQGALVNGDGLQVAIEWSDEYDDDDE